MTRHNVGYVIGVGGLRLAYRTWEAASARAALVVVHGLGEHAGRYAEFGERMAAFGISTYALDLRGHGMSEGRRGHAPSFDVFLQDVDRFRREVEGMADLNVPLFLLGHSMGGLIALRYQEEYNTRFEGAIICSPWLATALPVPRWKATVASGIGRLLPALPMRTRLDAALLSRDTDIVESYRDDPLVHDFVTPRLFAELSIAMGLALQRSDRLQEPLLILVAGADRIVAADRTSRFARSIAGTDVTVRTYAGHYHELLNELDRAVIHRQIRDWIAARVA
ncbi:MAG TPA: lysophospholipase [Longimicrobiales bacterium]|nr:lysophospholipase [Longimicrobiales bacterium]